MELEWLGHDGVRIRAQGQIIYIDPYHIVRGDDADLILVTHGHYDHFSQEDIDKIWKQDTALVTAEDCKTHLRPIVMRPGDKQTIKGVEIEAVPAYNTNKDFHPKKKKFLGYIVTVDGKRIYHAGDTDIIPEMKGLSCDIALLPVSGIYVMTADEAAEAAKLIRPKLAIPIHYGAGVAGTIKDAKRFASLLKDTGIEVEIKETAR